jgi:hypothetical protein
MGRKPWQKRPVTGVYCNSFKVHRWQFVIHPHVSEPRDDRGPGPGSGKLPKNQFYKVGPPPCEPYPRGSYGRKGPQIQVTAGTGVGPTCVDMVPGQGRIQTAISQGTSVYPPLPSTPLLPAQPKAQGLLTFIHSLHFITNQETSSRGSGSKQPRWILFNPNPWLAQYETRLCILHNSKPLDRLVISPIASKPKP